jgi:hypothetical protein
MDERMNHSFLYMWFNSLKIEIKNYNYCNINNNNNNQKYKNNAIIEIKFILNNKYVIINQLILLKY